MKYLSKISGSSGKIKKISADLTGGVCPLYKRGKNSPKGLINFFSDSYPWLSTRGRFKVIHYGKDISAGAGVCDSVIYFVSNGKFYYDLIPRFEVGEGKKTFQNYNGKILIFPNMICYDPQTDTHKSFGVSLENIQYKICARYLDDGTPCGLSMITSDSVDLTKHFSVGDSIQVSDLYGYGVSGFHRIVATNTDTHALIFEGFEFGAGDSDLSLMGNIGHGAPAGCDAACVCGGRVWIAHEGRIYASAINNAYNWAIGGDDELSAFYCEMYNGDKIVAIVDCEGSPVLFSENGIYKVYGDRASNFSIRCCSGWGGAPAEMSNCVSMVGNKIFYLTDKDVVCFDGVEPRRVENTPFSLDGGSAIACGCDTGYYICHTYKGTSTIYVYDDRVAEWFCFGNLDLKAFFVDEGALCAVMETELVVLSGLPGLALKHGYFFEALLHGRADLYIDTDGGELLELCVRSSVSDDGRYVVRVSYGGLIEEKYVISIMKGRPECLTIPLVPIKSDGIDICIEGTGDLIVKEVSVKVRV